MYSESSNYPICWPSGERNLIVLYNHRIDGTDAISPSGKTNNIIEIRLDYVETKCAVNRFSILL